jgi:hypothetical protein
MKKAFWVVTGVTAAASAGVLIYTWWWATKGFDNQEPAS